METTSRIKQQHFQQEVDQNAKQFSELLDSIRGTTKKDMERDSEGARITQGWEQLVKTTECKVIVGKLIATEQ